MKYKVLTVDFDDTSLEGIRQELESVLNKNAYAGEDVLAVIPVRTSYTTLDPDSAFREFSYTESGVLVVLREEGQPDV